MSGAADSSRAGVSDSAGIGLIRCDVADLVAMRQHAGHLNLKRVAARSDQLGVRRSAFRARGMDYAESRRYQTGDDMRNLDWRVMARTGKPYTKLFSEEKERPVLLSVDRRAGMFFATRGVFKAVQATRAAALIAWAAVAHGDRVGGFVFGNGNTLERRPARGNRGALGFIHSLADEAKWQPPQTPPEHDLESLLATLTRVARPGTLVVTLSDFDGFDAEDGARLGLLAAHSDVFNILVYDPLERELPAAGRYPIRDSQRRRILDTRPRSVRKDHRHAFATRLEELRELHLSAGARCVALATNDNLPEALGRALLPVMR